MITWGNLLLDLAKNIASLKGYLSNRRKEKRDRIAAYFDQISSTLLDAATAFERDDRPWDKYSEIMVHLRSFFEIVGDTFPDSATTIQLWQALAAARGSDRRLLGPATAFQAWQTEVGGMLRDKPLLRSLGQRLARPYMERRTLDAITVWPKDAVWKDGLCRDNPIEQMDGATIHSILREEVDRLREVAGLFRGYAAQLRASE